MASFFDSMFFTSPEDAVNTEDDDYKKMRALIKHLRTQKKIWEMALEAQGLEASLGEIQLRVAGVIDTDASPKKYVDPYDVIWKRMAGSDEDDDD